MELILIGINLLLTVILSILVFLQWSNGAYKKEIKDLMSEMLRFESRLDIMENNQNNNRQVIADGLASIRSESSSNARQVREELNNNFELFQNSILARMNEAGGMQKNQLDAFSTQLVNLTRSNEDKMEYFSGLIARLTRTNEEKLEYMRLTIEEKIKFLQEDNKQKLEEMRMTVDEKLNATLEHRLGESFKLVSERLELVHKGLGEMQTLASGVGDLKKVLGNVKTRGVWGEIQLGSILEQILSPEQYGTNVVTRKGSNERVEFAIRLPGRTNEEEEVLMPIDAKFPQEDYLRLVDACEAGKMEEAEEAGKQMEIRIKSEARDIRDKYLDPPNTTDFGIMFLPTESLYAEVVRRPGLIGGLQNDFRVIIAGPTTMAALLNSLAVGFKTLAIEKRSSEVWKLLGAVKTEFGKFGTILEKTKKKLDEASNTIETASRKTRTIERKLRQVEELPAPESTDILSLSEGAGE